MRGHEFFSLLCLQCTFGVRIPLRSGEVCLPMTPWQLKMMDFFVIYVKF